MIDQPPPAITLLGLGPGQADLLTRQAWDVLQSSPEIYLRTRLHPAVAGLPAGLQLHAFDELYEREDSFEAVYNKIVETVLALGRRPQGVVYAVPGHPYVAEATGPEIARRAREAGLSVRVVEGLSFLEPLCTALGIDPFPQIALVDALELASRHVPTFPPNHPAIIAQIHSPAVAADVKLTLMSVYPDEHPVMLVHAAGTPDELVERLALYEIDRSAAVGLLSALYLPPLGAATSFEEFQEIIARLRAPDGCPWDRQQTHKSLRAYLLEEAYEALSALDHDDPAAMCEEFGDLLLQIVLHAQIAAEDGEFNMAAILSAINTKLVRRHPHVFGELDVPDVHGVLQNWERLKQAERQANGKAEASTLDGVPLVLPALSQAQEIQKRAARVGFDWPEIQGVIDKVHEELLELHAATPEQQSAEAGDLLFAVVNLARWLEIDAESTLREASLRFRQRFSLVEAEARSQGKSVSDFSLEDLEAFWQAAKKKLSNPGVEK